MVALLAAGFLIANKSEGSYRQELAISNASAIAAYSSHASPGSIAPEPTPAKPTKAAEPKGSPLASSQAAPALGGERSPENPTAAKPLEAFETGKQAGAAPSPKNGASDCPGGVCPVKRRGLRRRG